MKIALIGDNTVTAGNVSNDNICSSYGIYSEKTLTIEGGGTLVSTGGETISASGDTAMDGSWSIGIVANSMTINSGTITAVGGTSTYKGTNGAAQSAGIVAGLLIPNDENDGTLVVNGGVITARGGNVDSDNLASYGICTYSKIIASGGTIYASAGEKIKEGTGYSIGMMGEGGVEVSGTAKLDAAGVFAIGAPKDMFMSRRATM